MKDDRLLMTITKDGLKRRINLCSNWNKIHASLRQLGISRTLYDIRMNDKDISLSVGRCSNELLKGISNLISDDEKLIDIHLVCKALQYGDEQFFELLPNQLDTYKSVKDILDDYRDFTTYKVNHLSKEDYEKYHSDRLNRNYEVMELFGKAVLFTEERIPSSELPAKINRYEVRSDDDGKGIMCQIGKRIIVNHWGTILSNHPIRLDEEGLRDIYEEKDIDYPLCPYVTLKQYMEEYKKVEKIKIR